MKKVLVEKVREDAIYFCDRHPYRECYSELIASSWYGSVFDMMAIEIHLCDECLTEMYELLEKKFGIKPKDIEL
jgi:hypothetical protein